MKIYIMYDQMGRIRGTAASGVDGARIGIHPSLSQIEEELRETDPNKIKLHLRHLHHTSKVDVSSKPHKRISKDHKGA